MIKYIYFILLLLFTPTLWSMNSSQTFDICQTLMMKAPKDIRQRVAPYLNILTNKQSSQLQQLFITKDAENKNLKEEFRIPCTEPITDIKIAADNRTVYIADLNEIREYDLNTRKTTSYFIPSTHDSLTQQKPTFATISNDCRWVAYCNSNGQRNWGFFNIQKKEFIWPQKERPQLVCSSSDSKMIVIYDGNLTLYNHNLEKMEELDYKLSWPPSWKNTKGCGIQAMTFSPDNKKLAIIWGACGIVVIHLDEKKQIHAGIIDTSAVNDITFLHDNTTIGCTTEHGDLLYYCTITGDSKKKMTYDQPNRNKCLHRVTTTVRGLTEFILATQRTEQGYLVAFWFDKTQEKPMLKSFSKDKFHKQLNQDKPINQWNISPSNIYPHSALAISKNQHRILVCSPDKSIICYDSRGFFDSIINRFAKLSFAQQLLIQAYDKLDETGKTPVKIESNTLEEKIIKWMDPLILEILLLNKVIEFEEQSQITRQHTYACK